MDQYDKHLLESWNTNLKVQNNWFNVNQILKNGKKSKFSCYVLLFFVIFLLLSIISSFLKWNEWLQITFILCYIICYWIYSFQSSKENVFSKGLFVSFLWFIPLFIVLAVIFFAFRKVFPDGVQKISGFDITIIAVFSFLLNKYLESIVNFEWEALDNKKTELDEKKEVENTGSLLWQKGFEKIVRMWFFFIIGTAFLITVMSYHNSNKSEAYYNLSGDIVLPEQYCFPTNTNDPVLSGIFTKIEDKEELSGLLMSWYYCYSVNSWEERFFEYIYDNDLQKEKIDAKKFGNDGLKKDSSTEETSSWSSN